MREQKEEREVAEFHPDDTARLLKFNITKQRIVDLCNVPFDEDWFDEAKDYSSWNRAMNGHPVWEGLVQALDSLIESQTAHPRQYLPADGPPEADQLVHWMKQIAGAPWWRDVLQLSASTSAFNAWYSGRPMGKDKVAEVKAKVDEWWARVMFACARAELASQGREFGNPGDGWRNPKVTSHFYHLVVEREVPAEDARILYQDMMDAAFDHRAELIDLTDPKDPLVPSSATHRDAYGQEFDDMVEAEYPGSTPYYSEPFEPFEKIDKKRWGDRRDEDSPKDLNEALYNLHYKVRTRTHWNPETRRSDGDDPEIIETSEDGVTWRAATEREKQGWDRGAYFFFEALNEGVWPDNSYTRELAELRSAFATEKARLQEAIDDSEIGEQEDQAWAAMNAAERRYEEAKIRLRLPD